MTSIIHFHYNTNKNVNIGDEAHVLAIQDALHSHIRDGEISNFPISFLCHYQLPHFPMSKRLPHFIHKAARVLRGTSYRQLLKQINAADLVVIGGGGVYMDHLLPFDISLLSRVRTPIVVFGAGYNRNFGSIDFSNRQRSSVRVLGRQAKLQSVRDTNTQDFLRKLGVSSELVADPAVFLKKASIHVRPSNNKLIIGINIAAHGWKQQPKFEQSLIDGYAAMIQATQQAHGAAFRYFIHHPGEYKIIQALEAKGINFEAIIDANARNTKAEYAAVNLTVSMMLHSTILAFGENKPSVCIGYDDKNKSFMELTGQLDRYIRVDTMSEEALIQKVEETIAVLDMATNKVMAKYKALEVSFDDFTSRVARLAEK